MRFEFKAKSNIEKFGEKVFNVLVENFSQTFFVGGAVRDMLLGKKITDIDIATTATPDEIIKCLSAKGINHEDAFRKYGNIIAKEGTLKIEITTFRKDHAGIGRYPKISFTKSLKKDSQRRDFTINSLYLSLKLNKILDPHNGLNDLKHKKIKFIGNPEIRIKQDPLRILRALRFALLLNFKMDLKTKVSIKKLFVLINSLTKNKIQKEIFKLKNNSKQKIFKQLIIDQKYLDKYFN